MGNISDIIESFLLEILGSEDKLVISRNELANYFSVAPSQINYVLTTRFTSERGYIIESKRGGGGSITVVKLNQKPHEAYGELFNSDINEGLSYNKASQILDRLHSEQLLSERESEMLRIILSDKTLIAPATVKDNLRLSILKAVLIQMINMPECIGDTECCDSENESSESDDLEIQEEDF